MSANPNTTPKRGAGSQDSLLGLSASEARLLLLGTIHVDSTGKIDFGKIATKLSITIASAKTMHLKARRKLLIKQGDDASASTSPTTPKNQTPKSDRRKATTDADEEDNEGTPTPPAKKPRGRKRKEPEPQPEAEEEPEPDAQTELEDAAALDAQLSAADLDIQDEA